MYFLLWLLFSVLLHSIVYWVMSDNLIASATTFVNIIMTISLMVAKYIMYRDDLKNGYIDISKERNKYKLFSEFSIYLPLFVLLIFTVIVLFRELFFKNDELLAILSGLSLIIILGVIDLLISYKDFIDNKLLVGLNKTKQ